MFDSDGIGSATRTGGHDCTNQHNCGKKYKSVYIGGAAIIIILSFVWWHQINFQDQELETYNSIAVLPLQDYSENQDKEYLALGLTDAITSELAKIKGLRVPSRGSAMYFQDSLRVYDEIAKELNVDLLLEGSIISEGEQLRVIIQLIDPTPYERHIWQNEYDQPYDEDAEVPAFLVCHGLPPGAHMSLRAPYPAKREKGRGNLPLNRRSPHSRYSLAMTFLLSIFS